MGGLYNSIPITTVARTLADLMGIPAPERAGAAADILVRAGRTAFAGGVADRALIYNPDAIGLWLFQKYTALFADAVLASDVQLPMLSVMPSVTPVCFASMYTGAMPDVHGIQAYVKPVLTTDTLFDALLRADKRPAIVSTPGDSVSVIFLQRDIDYFILDTPEACNEKALALMAEDRHDLIAVYNPNYDSTMHRHSPEADESMAALAQNIAAYKAFTRAAAERWKGRNSVVAFCPDHGCHAIDGGLGSHGLDMPDDMNVIHFYRFIGRG